MTDHSRPAALIDVDGVLFPYGTIGKLSGNAMRRKGYDYDPVFNEWVHQSHGAWLRELRDEHGFELVWCTLRTAQGNEWIRRIYDLPHLPMVDFDDHDRLMMGWGWKWKYPYVEEFAGTRPIVWFDDSFADEPEHHRDFLQARRGPTKLIDVKPYVGLTREHIREAIDWKHDILD